MPALLNQNVDVAISEFERSFRNFACAGGISEIGRNEVCFASCGPNFIDCLLPAFRIATHDHNMDAKLRQFIGCGATDSARSSANKRCRGFGRHVQFSP